MTSEQATRDLLNVISDVPVTFTWNSNDYTGTRGALVQRQSFDSGGFLPEPDLTISTTLKKLSSANKLIDRFPSGTPPALGEKVTIGGTVYRIDRVTTDELSAGIQFDLMSPHK